MLNRFEEKLLSASDIAKANNVELQEITKNAARSITQSEAALQFEETLPMRELLGLNKELRSIRGSLKVEMVKKFSWKNA